MDRTPIHDLVEKSRAGQNPYLITRVDSGWVMAAETPLIRGHCVVLADPVVFSINDLSEPQRLIYLRDCARVGDALIKVLGSYRINYETLCNVAQALHSHIVPRFRDESDAQRRERAAIAYPSSSLAAFDPVANASFLTQMREELTARLS